MIAKLRALWQEAFGDSAETLDAFFTTGFSSDRCHYLTENGELVSALYWLDCSLERKKLAYLYAVATKKAYRGRGLATRLMAETHEILKQQDYAGVILVPGEKDLFSYYEKLGYRAVTAASKFTAQQGRTPIAVKEIGATEFARLRRKYLPEGGVVQEGAALSFLQTYCKFYAGADFLMVASEENGALRAQEFLGNTAAAMGILQALGYESGTFCTPGNDRKFAMYLPLAENCPKPTYFGLALD